MNDFIEDILEELSSGGLESGTKLTVKTINCYVDELNGGEKSTI